IRRDSTTEKLASLRRVFDREHGTITAGNASPLTDGAAAVVLASEARTEALGLEPLAAVRSYAYAAVDPADQLLIAPAYAIPIALKRAGITLDDIDVFEMHEAFAAQVLSTLVVLERNGVGRVPVEKLNVMDVRLMDDLAAAIAAARNAAPRGLVVASGKEGQFVAGADLSLLRGTSQSDIEKASRSMQRVLNDLAALPCVTVAAINGPALGGGLEIALACDTRIAADAPNVRVGLT